MAWYDEEEEDLQDPFSNIDFGVGDYGFDQQQPTPMDFNAQTSPTELYDMSEMYNVPEPQFQSTAADEYGKYVQTEPKQSDFKNKWWQTLAGGFIGGLDATERGVAAGRQTRQNYLDQPYNRARQEWGQRAKQMGEQARIEQARNMQERQKYQTQLQAAAARVNAKRGQVLAKNTIESGQDARQTNALRRQLMPIKQFNAADGNVTQFNQLDPTKQTAIGKGAFSTPGERKSNLFQTIQAANLRNQRSIDAANQRQTGQQTFQREQDKTYRRTADDLNVQNPAKQQAVSNTLEKAMMDDQFDTLRSSGILTGGEDGVTMDRTKLDAIKVRVDKAIKAKQPVNASDYEILREWSVLAKKMGF